MSVSYLKNQPWCRWSREERLFCAVLFEHARRDPTDFAKWLIAEASLQVESSDAWDVGFEVCFYRDYLWQRNRSARAEGFPFKRTFDLCLFSERSIIIVEAKVCEPFDAEQNRDLAKDKELIQRLVDLDRLQVRTVALASSRYFANAKEYGWPDTLTAFDGKLTWEQVARKYPDDLLAQADIMYKSEPGQLL
jgi:hypothetical protein